jgi:hypothetical protein
MSTVHIVQEAISRPHCCAQCGDTRGPFLDTVVERMGERLYLCMVCLRIDAAEAGFAQGHRMDQLVDAKNTVEHAESEVDARNSQIRDLKKALASREKTMVELQVLVERLEGEIKRKDHLARLAADNATAVFANTEQPLVGIGLAG